jgi:hypothetical protein
MTRIEKIIVVALGFLCLSFVSYIIISWTKSQTVPVAGAPGPERMEAQNAVSPPPPVARPPSQSDYFLRAKQAVTRTLRDPDSAKFGPIFEGNGSSGRKIICGFVNARNGYGGYTGMERFIYFVDTDSVGLPSGLAPSAVVSIVKECS